MKTSIAILSAIVLSAVITNAEEDVDAENHKKPNPRERFEKIDSDGSGTISLAEFQAAPRAKENPDRAAEIFGKIDADGSGEISKEEMIKFAKEHKRHGHHPDGRKRDKGGNEDDNEDGEEGGVLGE